MERDLTTGSIGRNILKFSLPYFLSYFLQTLYGMADLFIIGQFNGVASTTAVSIESQVMHMIFFFFVCHRLLPLPSGCGRSLVNLSSLPLTLNIFLYGR